MPEQLLNTGWQFAKNEPKNFADVSLPHDWLIYDTKNLYETAVGWYRRELDLSYLKEGQRVFLRFDGVYMDSTLYVNGQEAGIWKHGYTAFEHDITDFVKTGSVNEILLKADHKAPNSRWYSGAGIYRDVTLKVKNACHFISDGIYITTKKESGGVWSLKINADINYASDADVSFDYTVTGGGKSYFNPIQIENPLLWDINSPNLYTLKADLFVDGVLADTYETRFGFRETEFTPNGGFLLNGRRVKLNGACQHHDLGALGSAVNKNALRRQLTKLREMGVNAIRTSHNPPSSVFMELTDEMGFLVMSELTDMWQLSKTEYDYARFFDEWVEKDAAAWVRRDRNCPSLIMWSVGNEIYDTHADFEKGGGVMKMLMALVEKHDPEHHARVTLCSNYIPWENTQKCADIIKLMGYNYAEYLYHNHHKEHPDWIIYGSETASTVQSRGIYHFPLKKQILADDDLQCSCLGNGTTSWGAKNVEAFLLNDRDADFSLGQFIWTGTDYIGEPTPYHTKNSYFGHIDTAGFYKDTFYIIQSQWTDYKKAPMVYVFPYWDFSPGQPIDVRVCSNAPKIELFLNGKSLGAYDINHESGKSIVVNFIIPYEKGELLALAYDENGSVIAKCSRSSFGDTARLGVKTDYYGDLAFCEITSLDKMGSIVENGNNRVNVKVTGGEILGMDNGDSTDFDQYKTSSRRLFGGRLLVIAKVLDADNFRIIPEIDATDIPVRKIELTRDGYNVKAMVYPQNASYNDIVWRLTDSGGIDSPLGKITVSADGRSAQITPKGDGELYIRCGAKNGREHIGSISYLPFEITGMGKPFLDPYSFISGGLSNLSNVELTIGNERGIGTLSSGESHVGFENLDFGLYGADEMELPLFSLSKEPFDFEVWEGMPDGGGRKLGVYNYTLGSVWNTYQAITVKLPEKLRGITTLCLVFRQKVHVKGFQFKKLEKAFEKIYFAENDSIYGDSFKVNGKAVEGIGNNVSVVFEGMDFGESPALSVEINSRSAKEKNSFQIVIKDEDGNEVSNMIEDNGTAGYEIKNYALNSRAKGKCSVRFIFLPGCDIDLEWFMFKK
ncbi:MAG: DUF4982 domain-containing protein [Clostridiales bacterium]|jgi:beta-galactosidase|nr:DUF4982 domain-containing protein [Clostridiales bacterium]